MSETAFTTTNVKELEDMVKNPFPSESSVRKPKSMRTIHADKIRDKIAEYTSSKIEPILEAMSLAATGNVWIEKETKDGIFKEQRAPDVNAARLLIENASGRPTQQLEMKAMIGIVDLVKQLEEESK